MDPKPLTLEEIGKRAKFCDRGPAETFGHLTKEEQVAWVKFFDACAKEIIIHALRTKEPLNDVLGGGLGNLFAMAHEYVRFYGPIWK